jgi:hypothetical protein
MEPEKKSSGATVGLVVILLILIIGGIYIWQSKMKEAVNDNNGADSVSAQDSAELDALESAVNSADANAGADVEGVN